MKVLTTIDLLALPSLETPPAGHVGFGAKSDGLYQKVGTVETKLAIDGHTHTIAQITGLQGALDLKAPLSNPTFTGNVTAPTFVGALSGNADSATTSNRLNRLGDNRSSFKPSQVTIRSLITTFSTQGALANQVNDSDYSDVIAINSYFDSSAGQVNALSFDKSSFRINHFMGAFGASSWNGFKTIAYLTDNVASATKLQTARTIAGVSFDGTANINIPFANLISKPTTRDGYGLTDVYTKTEVNSALALKLDKSVFDDLFEKVEISTGVYAIKAKYNFYSIGEVSAYGAGSGSGGGSSYNRLDSWADYATGKEGWVLSALLGVDLNNRLSNVESGSALNITTTGTGNAITAISKSGNTITATKGSTFSLDGHTHPTVTTSVDGLMSAADKTKLDGISAGARPGTVTSVGLSVPTGLSVTGSPITTSGTLAITLASGYAIPTTAKQGQWDTAYTHSQSAHAYLPLTGGTLTGNLTAPTFIGALSGNASSATKLQTARKIAGVSFDGTANIAIPFANLASKPTTLSGYGITDGVNKSALYVDRRTITPTSTPSQTMQFGFTSLNLNNSSPYADFIDFGGYKDSTGGVKNLLVFSKSDKTIRLYQGVFGSDNYNSYVDVWHSGNLTSLSQLTDNIGVATHIANKSNPHAVTTAQIGAVDLTTNQTIGGVKTFTGNVTAPTFIGALSGNASSATKLQTARTIWGQSFDGTGNVSGALTSVTNITASGTIQSLYGKFTNLSTNYLPKQSSSGLVNSIIYDNGTNVGIGTTSPGEKLTVYGTISNPVDNSGIIAGNDKNIGFVKKGGYNAHITTSNAADIVFSMLDASVITSTTIANSSLIEFVRIKRGGNVGIGTTSPSYKLDVNGTGRFTSSLITPKVDLGNGFTIEPSGTELVFKYNGVIKQRMLSDGTILATGEVTAFGTTS